MTQDAVQVKSGSPIPRLALVAIAGLALAALMTLAAYSMIEGDSNATTAMGPGGFGGPRPGAGAPQGGPGAGQGQQPNRGPIGQQPGQLGQAQQNVLPAPADIIGRVQNLTGRNLTVQTPQGQRVVQIDDATAIYKSDGSRGASADIPRGGNVAVVSAVGQDRLLHAIAILVLQ